METTDRQAVMAHYKLDDQTVDHLITRAAQACLAYQRGEMTLKQVWYRARGERFMMACQFHPDRDLGFRLDELADEFFTGYGGPDFDSADQQVFDAIARVVKAIQKHTGAVH